MNDKYTIAIPMPKANTTEITLTISRLLLLQILHRV